MRTIDVTYLVSTLGRTGPTNQLFNLISRLDRSRFKPSIVTISQEPYDSRIEDFKELGIPVLTLNCSRVGSLFRGSAHLSRVLDNTQPDVLHSQGLRADFLNSISGRNCAHISTQRNDPFHDYPMLFGFLAGLIIARIHKTILLRIPTIVSCSYSIEEANARRGIRCSTIQNGIETNDSFVVPHITKITRRVQLRLPQDKLLFICVAPLIHRKNIVNLIRTFGEARDAQTRHLILLGDGPLLTRARRLAAEFKNITVIGRVENVDEYLQASDCLLSASRSEGLPNSVIEALAWGLPVILSDIPAHREIHRIEKNAGSLFALQNHQALAQLIEDFERSDITAYAARSIAAESLNANVMANHYQDLYQSLAHASIKHQ